MEEHSPPSSKVESSISKSDLQGSASRMSPYRTRSRKASTLTEENIASHNDSPTPRGARRVTRRMSQGSENLPTALTPLPRRNRRSPSLLSEDSGIISKPKFNVAEENVLVEENEAVVENGSGNANKTDNLNNGCTDGSPKLAKTNSDSLDFTDTKVLDKDGSTESNNEKPTETLSKEAEHLSDSIESPTTRKVDGDQSINDSPKTVPIDSLETELKATPVPQIILSAASDATLKTVSECQVTETIAESSVDLEYQIAPLTVSPALTPTKSLETIDILDSSSEVERQTTPTVPQNTVEKYSTTPKARPQNHQTVANAESIMVVEYPSPTSVPENIQSVESTKFTPLLEESPSTAETLPENEKMTSTEESIMSAECPTTPRTPEYEQEMIVECTPVKESKKTAETLLENNETLATAESIECLECPTTPKTPEKQKSIVECNPLVEKSPKNAKSLLKNHETTATVDSTIGSEFTTTPKTKKNGKKSIVECTSVEKNKPTAKALLDKNEESIENPKTVSEINQIEQISDASPESEFPRSWSRSVRRKYDGKPIDGFGIQSNLTPKSKQASPPKKCTEIKKIDISDGDEEEESDEERAPRCEFIDDEAQETNGEDSMDEEEREYIEQNEIPEDFISLGSDSEEVEIEESDESHNSFIVSDSEIELLEGKGDDLEILGEQTEPKIPKRVLRSHVILDSSEEDVQKQLKELDAVPKKITRMKRRSDTVTPSKQSVRRQSLHPNTVLNSTEGISEEGSKTLISLSEESDAAVIKTVTTKRDLLDKTNKSKRYNLINDSSEEDVRMQLIDLDTEPKRIATRKRLCSETIPYSKENDKRMSLHRNVKLNSGELKKSEEESCVLSPSSNVDSENMFISKPNEELQNVNEKPEITSEVNVDTELENLQNEPDGSNISKRHSDSMVLSKNAAKRLSLDPNIKFDTVKSRSDIDDETKKSDLSDSSTKCKSVKSTPSNVRSVQNLASTDFDVDKIVAKCGSFLKSADEARQQEKMQNKVINEEKLQKRKLKKEIKLKIKREKEAKREQRAILAAQKLQLNKDNKYKNKELADEEEAKAIEKALAFSYKILKKFNHSTEDIGEFKGIVRKRRAGDGLVSGSDTDVPTDVPIKSKKKKRKMLEILQPIPNSEKKVKQKQTQQITAKPEGFLVYSQPAKTKKKIGKKTEKEERSVTERKSREREWTTAGFFDIAIASGSASTSQFQVASLAKSSNLEVVNFKEEKIKNADIPRESAKQLLSRKQKEKKLK